MRTRRRLRQQRVEKGIFATEVTENANSRLNRIPFEKSVFPLFLCDLGLSVVKILFSSHFASLSNQL